MELPNSGCPTQKSPKIHKTLKFNHAAPASRIQISKIANYRSWSFTQMSYLHLRLSAISSRRYGSSKPVIKRPKLWTSYRVVLYTGPP